ncbi:MAG TPA: hypothetical protein VN726_06495 [Hanamia sp.]|nr:hypothetical protein [Hanamia sp.]
MEIGYKNLGYFFLILSGFVFLGFFKTYFGLFPQFNAETTSVVHFHFFIQFLWVCILITQPLLIRFEKFKTHRVVGQLTYMIVPLIVISIFLMWQKGITDPATTNSPANYVSYLFKNHFHSSCDLLLLVTFYSLAIFNKQTTKVHMRYMIAIVLLYIDPTLSRLLSYWFNISDSNSDLITILFTDLILLGLILYDIKYGRFYKPYIVALSLFLIYHICYFIFKY